MHLNGKRLFKYLRVFECIMKAKINMTRFSNTSHGLNNYGFYSTRNIYFNVPFLDTVYVINEHKSILAIGNIMNAKLRPSDAYMRQ